MIVTTDTQVFKNKSDVPFGGKRTAFILAVLIFVIAAGSAAFYGRLAELDGNIEEDELKLTTLPTNAEFLTHTQLANGAESAPKIDSIERIVKKDKPKMEFIFLDKLYRITSDSLRSEDWEFVPEGTLESVTSTGEVFLVATKTPLTNVSCPIALAVLKGVELSTPCTDVLVNSRAGGGVAYSLFAIDSEGSVKEQVTILGGAGDTQVLLTPSGALLAQNLNSDVNHGAYRFFLTRGPSFLPAELITKIQRLETYDITPQAKLMEMELAIRNYYSSLPEVERAKFISEFSSKYKEYLQSVASSPSATFVAQFSPSLEIVRTLTVDGHLVENGLHASSGDFFMLTVERTPGGGGGGTAKIHALSGRSLSLGSFPESAVFSGNWAFLGDGNKAIKLDSFEVFELAIDGEHLLVPFESYFLVLHKLENLIGMRIYSPSAGLLYQTSIKLAEPWESIRTSSALTFSGNLLYLPGTIQDYLIETAQEAITIKRTLVTLDSDISYILGNYLYILGDNVYIMELDTNEIVAEFNI